MKIKRLSMQAFGPFYKKTVIDFQSFENGLLLIAGKTGSGKTSIFDAISFALFGQSSGDYRDVRNMRSDYAKPNEKTEVELLFEYRKEEYFIRRTLGYERKKTRGEGYTSVAPSAELVIASGKILSKVKDVNEKIEEILKLNRDQFSQILMIAQGEFMKMIHSSSKDKSEIFRKMFRTQRYEMLRQRARTKVKDLENFFRDVQMEKQLLLTQFDPSLQDELLPEVLLAKIQNFLLTQQEMISKNEEQIHGLKEEIKQQENELKRIQKENEKILEKQQVKKELKELLDKENVFNEKKSRMLLAESAKIIESDVRRVEDEINAKEQLDGRFQEVLLELEKEQKIRKEIEEVEKNYPEWLQEQADNIKTFSLLERKIDEAKKKNQLEEEYNRFKKIKEEYIAQLNQLEDKSCKLQQTRREKVEQLYPGNIKLEILEKDREIEKIQQYIDRINEIEKIDDQLDRILLEKESFDREYEKLQQEVLKAKKEQKSYAVHLLLDSLKENEPCPLCGSLDHPKISNAQASQSQVLDKLLEKKEEYAKKEQRLLAQIEHLSNDRTKLLAGEEVKKELVEIELTHLQAQWTKLKEEDKKQTLLEEEIPLFDSKIEAIKKEMIVLKEESESVFSKLDELKGSIQMLADEESLCLQQLEQKIEQINARQEFLKKSIEEFTHKNQQNQRELQKYSVLEKELRERLDKKQVHLKELNENLDAKMRSLKIKDIEDFYSRLLDEKVLEALKEEIVHYQKNREMLEQMLKKMEEFNLPDEVILTSELEEKIKKREIELRSFIHEKAELEVVHREQVKLQEQIGALLKKEVEIEEEVSEFKELDLLLAGNLSGTQRLSFERYIQQQYFEEILQRANDRMRILSDGRYEIVLREENSGGSPVGLDMDIYDVYTGKRRDIKTLSGGESFKAALAIALGLSDLMEELSGAVQMDMMFIDEGFATLDEESLHLAIQVLGELSSGTKLIGLISHVDELKQSIDQKILVNKSDTGSTIELHH